MSEVSDADANPPAHFSAEPDAAGLPPEPGPTDSSDSDDKDSGGGGEIPGAVPGAENGGSEGNLGVEVPAPLPPKQEAVEPVSDADDGSSRSFPWGPLTADGDDAGTEEEQAAFMRELEGFFRGRGMEFKPPKFYGEGLNCLKLWRAVIKLGGYETVTSHKLWRQVGESFNPPRTCTTVSWSFRCFYEKALLDYERHKVHCGELNVHVASPIDSMAAETQVDIHICGMRISHDTESELISCEELSLIFDLNWNDIACVLEPLLPGILKSLSVNALFARQTSLFTASLVARSQAVGPVRIRRDAAARAMQGWHSQGLLGNGYVVDPLIKDKSPVYMPKHDKQLKSLGVLKRKSPSSMECAVNATCIIGVNPQVDAVVADIGPAADWVKINVRRTNDCFEIYALVPGLLREEVRVQSDPAGRLVISGEPGQPDNPWGVTPFKKIVSLPSRIDPHQTTAVVTLHGQLFVRAPFEQPVV